jgi:hypothetical protein
MSVTKGAQRLGLARPAHGGKRHVVVDGKTLCGKAIEPGVVERLGVITCNGCWARYRALGGHVLRYRKEK